MVQWIKQYSVRVDENVVVLYSPQLDIHKNKNQTRNGNNLGRNGFLTKTKLVEKMWNNHEYFEMEKSRIIGEMLLKMKKNREYWKHDGKFKRS